MQRVFVAETPAQAHLVLGLLEEEGIEGVVEGEMLTGARFALGMDSSTLPQVYVRDEDVGHAVQVLRDRGQAPSPGVPPPIPYGAAGTPREKQGLTWFKAFLQAWLIATAIGFCVALVAMPGALVMCVAFGLVVAGLWTLVRHPRAGGTKP